MNEFTIRIVCNNGNPEAATQKGELCKLLTAEGWFRVVEGSGEETGSIADIVALGFSCDGVFVATIDGRSIRGNDLDSLCVELHRCFFARWVRARKSKPPVSGANQ